MIKKISETDILNIIQPDANFVNDIEDLVQNSNTGYLEAILHWCTLKNVEYEQIVPIIRNNPNLKIQITIEAEKLHCIKSTKSRLPI